MQSHRCCTTLWPESSSATGLRARAVLRATHAVLGPATHRISTARSAARRTSDVLRVVRQLRQVLETRPPKPATIVGQHVPRQRLERLENRGPMTRHRQVVEDVVPLPVVVVVGDVVTRIAPCPTARSTHRLLDIATRSIRVPFCPSSPSAHTRDAKLELMSACPTPSRPLPRPDPIPSESRSDPQPNAASNTQGEIRMGSTIEHPSLARHDQR